MEIEQIKETIISWDTMLSQQMKKYIHYRSMRNFVSHYDEVKNVRAKEKICSLLSSYIEEVKANDYSFEGYSSGDLAKKYLFELAEYYREYSNFMRGIRIQMVFLFGIMGDSLLYFTGVLADIWHIPIVTVGLLMYYLFITIFKEPKGRVYGMFY